MGTERPFESADNVPSSSVDASFRIIIHVDLNSGKHEFGISYKLLMLIRGNDVSRARLPEIFVHQNQGRAFSLVLTVKPRRPVFEILQLHTKASTDKYLVMARTLYTTKTLSNGVNALVGGGAGTPIVCLSGWPQTAAAFDEIFPFLADAHHVVVLDLPGLGDSSPSTDGYDTKAISSILAKVVESELGPSTRYHLVGHDVGAWVAYSWAAQYGSSLLSLTLIDSTIPGLVVLPEYPLPDAPNIKLWQFSFNRLPQLPEILTEGRERQLLDWLFEQKSAHPERIAPAKRDRYVSCYSRPGGMSNGFAYYRAIPENIRQNREEFSVHKLQMPVLAIGGAQAAGEMMKTTLSLTAKSSESRFVAIADCGHYVMEEQPEAAAREILAFVAEIETF